ncbi:hypothetical protein [Asaia bogorensis]|uniref:hypothetical protein n=1 Tax=Asaia bogorensis TaxID=91915 RepID=UPI000EFBF9C5|nr:hypothetical protein [Asaia bogorensis]
MIDAVCGLMVLYLISIAVVLIGLEQLMAWIRCRKLQANLRLLDELNSQPETQTSADRARHAHGEEA